MLHYLPPQEQQRLKDILANLKASRAGEPSLMQVELQFFEVLNLLHQHSSCPISSGVLSRLRAVQNEQYACTQNRSLTVKSAVVTIRKFKRAFKSVLFEALHKPAGVELGDS